MSIQITRLDLNYSASKFVMRTSYNTRIALLLHMLSEFAPFHLHFAVIIRAGNHFLSAQVGNVVLFLFAWYPRAAGQRAVHHRFWAALQMSMHVLPSTLIRVACLTVNDEVLTLFVMLNPFSNFTDPITRTLDEFGIHNRPFRQISVAVFWFCRCQTFGFQRVDESLNSDACTNLLHIFAAIAAENFAVLVVVAGGGNPMTLDARESHTECFID